MRRLSWILALALIHCSIAQAQEDADFGVPPTRDLRIRDHAAPTPLRVPGATTLRTSELRRLLGMSGEARPLLFDVIGDEGHDSLPGAIWLPGAGRGEGLADAVQERLATTLAALTGHDRSRPLVFFCTSAKCWLSYNAALRASSLGYKDVYWYRGGIEGWLDAGGSVEPLRQRWRYPP